MTSTLVRATTVVGVLGTLAWPARGHAQPAATAEHAAEPPASAEPPAPHRPRFYVRLGGAGLLTFKTSSTAVELTDIEDAATLALQNGPIEGSGATIESRAIFAGTVGYVLPILGRRLSLEVVAGLPFTVKFQATGTLADKSIAPMALGIPTGIGPLGKELGEADAIPIVTTVVVQQDLGWIDPAVTRVRPFLGVGPSWLFVRNAEVTNPILTEVRKPDMTVSSATGIVLQGGIDVELWRRIYARVDVKYIAGMTVHAEVRNIAVKTPGLPLFDSVEVGTAKTDLDVNPFIVQAGVGFDFDLW